MSTRTEELPTDASAAQLAATNQPVRRLRTQVADRLNQQRRRDEVAGRPPMTSEDERHYAGPLSVQVLEDHAAAELAQARAPPTAQGEDRIGSAIRAGLAGCG